MADRVRYYRVKGENAFWEPGQQAEAFSLPRSQPLGPAGPEAKKAALDWNARLDEARCPAPKKRAHAPGTLGHFYEVFQTKTAWKLMEPRTREDYDRAWPVIEARFGQTVITKITADDSERFHADLHPAHNPASEASWNEAHRTLKVWRALLGALKSYELRASAPIGRVSNPAPRGRDALWRHDEVMTLAWAAALHGYGGMAAAIRVIWDAMLSPVDGRQLSLEGWRAGATSTQIRTERAKTQKRVVAAITPMTAEIVEAHLATLPDLLPTSPIFRQPNGRSYSKDTFGDHFRIVRGLVFPGDARQLLDLRRSAATEARLGGATKDDLGKAMANRIDASEALAQTYLLTASETVLEARARGREKMAAANG